jgi:hypothetical protein
MLLLLGFGLLMKREMEKTIYDCREIATPPYGGFAMTPHQLICFL